MKHYIDLKTTNHKFEKQNLVTLSDKRGHYDKMFCVYCGLNGKRYNFANVEVDGRTALDKVNNCPNASAFNVPESIEIIHCTAVGNQFSNLEPGSRHEVVTPPEGYKNDKTGVWVMGVGEPVKVLTSEYRL